MTCISDIVSSWTSGIDRGKAVVEVFRQVRDIPYGTTGSSDPLRVYELRRGTSCGKHLLLASTYAYMGLDVMHMVAPHNYSHLPRRVPYPKELAAVVKTEEGIPDYHYFIRIHRNDHWRTVDATFDAGLQGCLVVNDWDGTGDTALSVRAFRVLPVAQPLEFMTRKLDELPWQIQKRRQRFLRAFSSWLVDLRGR